MSLKEFRNEYLDLTLDFLWRQWSALGVLGGATAQDSWAIDPEALLVFSLQVARYEPRLFDEILGWLMKNGDCLDSARLRSVTVSKHKTTPEEDTPRQRVFGAVIQYLSVNSNPRKWQNFADMFTKIYKGLPQADSVEPLFMGRSGESYPLTPPQDADPAFMMFFLNRSKFQISKNTREVPVNAGTNIRFMLRSLFGIGARAESVLYLLTHDGGRPRDIADATGFFWLSVQDVLVDLENSRLVQSRSIGKKEYFVNRERWWQFISYSGANEAAIPKWLNWQAIFSALSNLLQALETIHSDDLTEYMTASKIQYSVEMLYLEFTKAGIAVPPPPQAGLPPDMYEKTAINYLRSIFTNNPVSVGA